MIYFGPSVNTGPPSDPRAVAASVRSRDGLLPTTPHTEPLVTAFRNT